MLSIKTNDNITVCGKKKSGKSCWLKWLLRPYPKWILIDRNWEHDKPPYPLVAPIAHTPEQITDYWAKGYRKIIFQPLYRTPEELDKVSLIALQIGNLAFIVEECDRFVNRWTGFKDLPRFADIVHTGSNHYGIGLIALTRRIRNFHSDIHSQTDHVIAFYQHNVKDIESLCAEFDEKLSVVANLNPDKHQWAYYNDSTGQVKVYEAVIL